MTVYAILTRFRHHKPDGGYKRLLAEFSKDSSFVITKSTGTYLGGKNKFRDGNNLFRALEKYNSCVHNTVEGVKNAWAIERKRSGFRV